MSGIARCMVKCVRSTRIYLSNGRESRTICYCPLWFSRRRQRHTTNAASGRRPTSGVHCARNIYTELVSHTCNHSTSSHATTFIGSSVVFHSHGALAAVAAQWQPSSSGLFDSDGPMGPVMLLKSGRSMESLTGEEKKWLAQGRAAFCNF